LELESRNCHDLAYRSAQQLRMRTQAARQVVEDREQLILRMQKAKVMQTLYDQHQFTYRQMDALAEQKVLDELGGMQQQRQKKAGR